MLLLKIISIAFIVFFGFVLLASAIAIGVEIGLRSFCKHGQKECGNTDCQKKNSN